MRAGPALQPQGSSTALDEGLPARRPGTDWHQIIDSHQRLSWPPIILFGVRDSEELEIKVAEVRAGPLYTASDDRQS
jgi:hypothetical protein